MVEDAGGATGQPSERERVTAGLSILVVAVVAVVVMFAALLLSPVLLLAVAAVAAEVPKNEVKTISGMGSADVDDDVNEKNKAHLKPNCICICTLNLCKKNHCHVTNHRSTWPLPLPSWWLRSTTTSMHAGAVTRVPRPTKGGVGAGGGAGDGCADRREMGTCRRGGDDQQSRSLPRHHYRCHHH